MFQPGADNPHGHLRNPSNPAQPSFAMQGGRRMVPNVSGPYPGFPPSSSQPLVADNFPMDPPSMPRDPEMLKNIDLLSSFVVKNGPEFEQLARTKQIGDPKFGFLFGGEPDTDAAIGQRYYEWKKQALKASLQSQSGSGLHSERPSAEDAEKLTSDAPPSPVGSDMDMEDDFSAPAPALEKKVASRIVQPVDTKAFPVIEGKERVDFLSPSEGKDYRTVAPGAGLLGETGTGPKENLPPESRRRRDTRRRTGFDRSCMEDISPSRKSVSPSQQPLARSRDRVSDQDRKPSSVANGHHGEGTPRSSRWAPPEPSFILEAPESNETSSLQKPEKSETAEKLEAVTPPTADDLDPPENKRRSDGRRIQDPKNAIRDSSVLEPGGPTVDEFGRLVRRATSDSDGDDTRHGKKRRRSPSRSQSRSRSPGEHLRRHHSRSRSPPRRRRRSRSHSHSSRRHRSYSPSPPPRDSRRGAESSWGSDRRFQERGARRGGQGERVGGSQPACFDFSRGRCFRGSSCRFLHADNNSNGASSGELPGRGGGRYGSRGGRSRQGDNNDDGEWARSGGRSSTGWTDEGPRARRNWDSNTSEKGKENENMSEKVLDDKERHKPEGSPSGDYGDDQSAKLVKAETKEKSDSKNVKGKPSAFTDPPPLARLPTSAPFSLPHSTTFTTTDVVNSSIATLPPQAPDISGSQVFSSLPSAQPVPAFATDVSEKNYTAHALMMQQPGFDGSLPPPPPLPPFMEHHHSSQLQASYPVPVPQSPAYSQISGHLHPAGFPQMGIQHPPIPLRPGSAWPTAHTVNQPIQGYGIPSSTSTPPQQTNLQPFSQQHPHVSASKEQYDPLMADSFEPEPPGAREVAPKPELGGPQDISMVIMERVSPGLPSRHHPVTSTTVSQGDSLVTETLSPTTLVPTGKQRSHSAIESLHAHPATVVSTHGSFPSHINNQVSSGLENVSPATDENQNWNSGPVTSEKESGPTGDTKDRDHNQLQSAKNDKEEHSRVGRDKEGRVKEGRGLTLVRAAVTEYVKDVLKPTWREGHMSKEAFKTIAKKAVDKVLGALQPHQIPKTPEKVDTYMTSSRPKILKLVQGYVDKYVKV